MHIEGEMEVGEAVRYAGRATSRLSGHPRPMIVANVVAAVATAVPLIVLGVWQAAVDTPAWVWLPALPLAMAFGFWAGPAACRRYSIGTFRKNLAERGLDNRFISTFSVTDDAFVSSTGRMTATAEWAAVSDVVETDRYWILLVEGEAKFLPRRFFPSPNDEKAFLQAILERMSPEARARSGDAVKFSAN